MTTSTVSPVRFIPSNYVQYKPNLSGYENDLFECYVRWDNGKSFAMFFQGKRKDPAWHYCFKNDEEMKKKVNESISQLMSWSDRKQERKEARKNAVLGVEVGQIYYYSWGYDQTNIDFFQVIDVKGKVFTISAIRGRQTEKSTGSSMASYVVPVRDAFKGEPIVKRSFSMDHGILSLTNETEEHYSSWDA